jgi:hypothetical protein
MNTVLRLSLPLVLSVVVTCTTICDKSVTKDQARAYIGHVWETLFLPHQHEGRYGRELKNALSEIRSRIVQRAGTRSHSYSLHKRYNSDRLYAEVLREAVEFIKKQSKEFAHQELKDLYTPARVDERVVRGKAVDTIVYEVQRLVNRSVTLEPGIFTNYTGVPLRTKIAQLIKAELKKLTPAKPQKQDKKQKLYPTSECPVCYDHFNTRSTQRVYLKCGHNLCTGCLRDWYYSKHKECRPITCPLCRAVVNIADYASELWAPSAPAFGK